MDYRGPGPGIGAAEMLRHYIQEAPRPAALGRDDRQTDRLVHGDEIIVLVEEDHGLSRGGFPAGQAFGARGDRPPSAPGAAAPGLGLTRVAGSAGRYPGRSVFLSAHVAIILS